jgi:hypothetical protein
MGQSIGLIDKIYAFLSVGICDSPEKRRGEKGSKQAESLI